MPNVVNLTQAAGAAITGAGLVVGTVTTDVSSTVSAGSVISENPPAGNTVASGSPVNLVIGAGSTMPDVIGQPQATAIAGITAAGLVVGTVTTGLCQW